MVSVIMPAYNSAEFIGEAITSVLEQTYNHWELLIVDDASVDHTHNIAREFEKKDARIRLSSNKLNYGAGAARNKGIEAARGSFIAFLDADDLWLPEKLETQVNFLLENELEMTFSSYYLISEDGEDLNKFVEALPVLTYQKLLKSNYVGNLTGIYNVERTGKVYAPLLRKRQDWGLWLNLLSRTGETKSINLPLAKYRIRKNSLSQNKAALIKYNFRIYREFLGFSYLKSCRYMSMFLWEHFNVKNRQVKNLDKRGKLL